MDFYSTLGLGTMTTMKKSAQSSAIKMKLLNGWKGKKFKQMKFVYAHNNCWI